VARDTGIARRYAQALFLAAQKKDAVDRVWDDLQGVLAVDHAAGDRFRHFLEAPQVPTEHKFAALEATFRPVVHGLVVEFFRLLLNKKRLFELRTIVGEFGRLVEDHKGVVRARVTSALPLEDKELGALVKALESGLKKQVSVVSNVDPGILGGLVVRVGDRIADRSVRTMLTQLREQLLAARAS
jgi:F-type H+-transporting ATPase subunit delta